MRYIMFIILMMSILVIGAFQTTAMAQSQAEIRARVNAGTVKLITGGLRNAPSTYSAIARDLAGALDQPGKLRVLPIMGYGAVRNVEDMLYLQGVDVGMMPSDILKYLELNGKYAEVASRLRLLLKLYDEPFHVIARSNIESVADLAGKRIAIGPAGSGAEVSSRTLLQLLDIKADLLSMTLNKATNLLRAGDISAIIHPARKGSSYIRVLKADEDMRLLPIQPTGRTSETYAATQLTNEDYPNFVSKGETLATLQKSAVLAVFNWSSDGVRYPQVRRFVDAMFENHANFKKEGRHPVWQNVDWAANVLGWKRYGPVQDVLDRLIKEGRISRSSTNVFGALPLAPVRAYFAKYIAKQTGSASTNLNDENRKEMFDQFLRWPKNPIEITVPMRYTQLNGPGDVIGTITLSNTEIAAGQRKETGLLIKPNLKGLKHGRYAFHVHENPACGAARKEGRMVKGLAAGEHIWLTGTGQLSGVKFGTHLGDLPDLEVDGDGSATKPTIAARLSLADIANRSLMIHASQDDASARMGCGAIK